MMMRNDAPYLLEPYRVLDLTDEKAFFCGKILSDMGADVVKIEKPGGDASRTRDLYFSDEKNAEKNLFWLAYNVGKRGITLDIETQEGQELFKKLIPKTDFVIESFEPGYLDSLGLGYDVLKKINSRIIITSITPFGQEGPYAKYKASDLVLQSMAGLTYITGDPDRPPVYWNQYISYLFGCVEAACATMIAHLGRVQTGIGDHIDISLHESMLNAYWGTLSFWQAAGIIHERKGIFGVRGNTKKRVIWACKDGLVVWQVYTGQLAWQMNHLIEWMKNEGMSEGLENIEWEKLDWELVNQKQIDSWEEVIGKFFLTHTVTELYEEAVKIGTILYPVYNLKDLIEYSQLQSRGFWTSVEYTELNNALTYPGAAFRCSESPLRIQRPAPSIGEHNDEIFENELRLGEERISKLKQKGVI